MASRIAEIVALLVGLLVAPQAHSQFETRSSFYVGAQQPESLVVGDFNRDGIPDVAVPGVYGSGNVEILLGNGDGTFRHGATYAAAEAFHAAAASLRNNGILDLVVGAAGEDYVYVLLGNGDGTFQSAVPYPTTAHSYMVAVGDFTGTGNLDILDLEAVTSQGQVCDCVEVLPGNGDGTFGPPITTPLPYSMTGYVMAIGDFDLDGKIDVAVGGEEFPNYQVAILLGNGDGTFTADGYYLVYGPPSGAAAAYFTSSKTKLDLAVSNGPGVSILLGNGDGTFQQQVSYPAANSAWVTAQDLTGDGKVDLAVADSGEVLKEPAGVDVLYGNGDGTFQPEVVYPIPGRITAYYVAATDLNNDGKPDLAVVDFLGQHVITLLNTGAATFSPTTPLSFEKQLLGTTSTPMSTTITNSGTSDMTFSSIHCSGAPFRMTGNTCTGSLAPGAQCSISADFTARATGLASGTITINDSASSKPLFIQLVGQGTSLGIAPGKLQFPTERVGALSQPRAIHLTNVGSSTITFDHPVGVFGAENQDFPQTNDCGLSLAANASCTVTITFAPQHKGTRSAYVEMEDNGGDSPQYIPLSGIGD
jgi:hypothetical protein